MLIPTRGWLTGWQFNGNYQAKRAPVGVFTDPTPEARWGKGNGRGKKRAKGKKGDKAPAPGDPKHREASTKKQQRQVRGWRGCTNKSSQEPAEASASTGCVLAGACNSQRRGS